MEFLLTYNYRLSYRRGRENANANFISRLQLPPTVEDISGSSALSDPDDLGVYLIRACGYTTPSCPIPGVSLDGLTPSSYNNPGTGQNPFPTPVLGALPLTKYDFRTHRASMPLRRMTGPTTNTFATPTDEPCLSYAFDDQHEASWSNCARRTRSRTATLTGNTPLRPDYHMAARSGFAASAAPPPPPKAPIRSSLSPRSARPGPAIPLRRPTSPRMATVPNPLMGHSLLAASLALRCTTLDDKISAAAKQHLSNTLLSYSHSDWDRAQRTDPLCDATRRYIQLGHPNPLPRSLCNHLPSHTRPETADISDLAAKCRLLQGDDDSILLVRKPITANFAPDVHNSRRSRTSFDDSVRIYVPHMARPWIMHACHADDSCHLGVTRTLIMLERFHWWVGMEACTKWWVRRCLKCQTRKPSRQTIRWPTLSILLPNSPAISVSVDYFGPLPITARGNSYILLLSDRFSRRANMFTVTAAEFTAEGTANILVNRFIPLWGCPSALLSDSGLQFCSQLATAVYKPMGIHKLTTSAYHPSGNGGVERVSHTMVQMLVMVCNEHQNDWNAHLPHIEHAYNNSVSAAKGLAFSQIKCISDAYRASLSPSSTAPTAEPIRASTATTSPIATSSENGDNTPTSSCVNSTPSQLLV